MANITASPRRQITKLSKTAHRYLMDLGRVNFLEALPAGARDLELVEPDSGSFATDARLECAESFGKSAGEVLMHQ